MLASGRPSAIVSQMKGRCALVWLIAGSLILGGPSPSADGSSIQTSDLREWLTYLASDELQGRATFSEGLGLAAAYIQERLTEWRLTPAGDRGGYLQSVKVQEVRTTSRSSVTVRVGRETRVFRDGGGVTFPRDMGGVRTITLDRVQFAGYGLDAPAARHNDFAGSSLEGVAVVYLGAGGPKSVDATRSRRVLDGRSRHALDQLRAVAVIGPTADHAPERTRGASGGSASDGSRSFDFTSAERLDRPVPPSINAADAFYEFLLGTAPVRYPELKRRASAGDPLPTFALTDVSLTFTIDADYTIVRTRYTHNVVGVVPGTDPSLRHTYVAFGAHYDHVGYADREITNDGTGAPGRVTRGAADDRVWNGADDDGSGTVALMAIAKAFATSPPRPRRSLLFVWHAGEERGLWGSRYFADTGSVPMDRIVSQLNIDMVGRNRNDDLKQADTVYLVGSDRLSTELHDVNRAANASLTRPLRLDYKMNDPSDLEQMYYRSDHYSYAAKGVPVIFFTTGLHPDYHANTDEVAKIEFDKLTRITRLVYETGARLADLDHPPVRDRRGPRAGRGTRE